MIKYRHFIGLIIRTISADGIAPIKGPKNGIILPDKAIDLLDEAASALRIEIDTMPEEIDILIREKIQLEMNKKALEKDETQEPY